MRKISKNTLILVTLFILLILCLFNTDFVIQKTINYSELFFYKLFPVSFIFFVLTNMLINYNFIDVLQRTFNFKSKYFIIFILSMISGFPSGAFYTKEMLNKNIINNYDANRIIMFSHFPNPLFVINSVGLVLNSNILALKILISIYISNFIIMIISYHSDSIKNINNNSFPIDFSSVLNDCIIKSIKILITIFGISIFFILISAFIVRKIHNPILYVIINGFFDLTNGVYSTLIINSIFIRSILILVFIVFGSVSILLQTKSIITDTNIYFFNYIKGRFISTIMSIIIFCLIYFI